MLGMVRAPPMNQAMLPTQQLQQQQQQQQQQRGPVPPPMQQLPLPPQPRPVQPSVIPGQVQQTNSVQPMTYQPPQVQQQSLPQVPFQHQGDMVQQNSVMPLSYVQQGVPPPPTQTLQQQYQQLQQNPRMDGTPGLLSIGQAGMISGSEAVMGPGGLSQIGRNMNISQAGQLGGMGPGALMNQQPCPPLIIPGQGMHGLVMGVGQPMGSGNQAGVPVSSGSSLMGAPLVPDNRSSYGNQNALSDDSVASASAMPQPHMYGMPTQGQVPQQQFPQMAGELEQQRALLQQVLSLTPEQINSLPPEQRQQVLQLQQVSKCLHAI